MSTTLEVILKTAGFTEGATAIKKVGDEATNTNNKLKTTTSTVDQVSRSTTSLGSKLANAGKQFSGTITNVAALGSTVVNLNRQYQDLSDTQIRVDRTQLKVSKTAEAVRTAQSKLNEAVKKYGAGSAEAQKAQLDLTQAQEASTLAVTMNGEALEDQQRAYENFAMNLAPTILTAGSSITSMFKEMGGTKGFGGLKTALGSLKGAFTGLGGLGGIATGLTGIGNGAGGSVTGINGMTKGVGGLSLAMQGLARSSLPVAIALGGVALVAKAMALVVHEVIAVMKGDMLEAVKTMEKFSDLAKTIGPLLGPAGGVGTTIFTTLGPQLKTFREELQKVPPAIKPIPTELQSMDNIAQGIDGTIDSLVGGVLGLVRSAEGAPKPLNETGGAIAGIGTNATQALGPINALTNELDGWNRMRDQFLNPKAVGLTGLTKVFALDPTAISESDTKLNAYIKTIKNFSTHIDAGAVKVENYASKARFLDENLKPLGPMFDQMAGALEQANANLNASTVGLSNYQIGVKNANTSVAEWNVQSQIKISQDTQELASIKALAQSYGIHTGTVGDNVEVLKLLIQAQQAARQGNMKLAASFMDAAKAAQKSTQAMSQNYAIGIKIKGYEPGKTTGGPKYVTYRNGKVIGYGPGTAPQQRTPGVGIQLKQHGHQGTVHRPTMFIAGEGGRPEDVTVRPRGSVQRGGSGGGGGGSTHITVSFEPQEFAQFIRYRINDNQGVVK